MIRLFNLLSVFVRTNIKWSNKLKNTPQPKTEMHFQKALLSAVFAEFEIEFAKDHMAIELVSITKSLLTLLFALTAAIYAPKSA
jgi:hypothetical protein